MSLRHSLYSVHFTLCISWLLSSPPSQIHTAFIIHRRERIAWGEEQRSGRELLRRVVVGALGKVYDTLPQSMGIKFLGGIFVYVRTAAGVQLPSASSCFSVCPSPSPPPPSSFLSLSLSLSQ